MAAATVVSPMRTGLLRQWEVAKLIDHEEGGSGEEPHRGRPASFDGGAVAAGGAGSGGDVGGRERSGAYKIREVVAGQPIAEGEFVMLSYAAACRDPRIFENPHEVDIDRKIAVNPAFSFGPHRCIGSHIARLQATITLEEMLRRIPDIALAPGTEPEYSNSTITRNMDSLRLVFTPGGREAAAGANES